MVLESRKCRCFTVRVFSLCRRLMTGVLVRYANIFYSTWGLLVAGLLFALPMMHMRITDYTDVIDDRLSVTLSVRDDRHDIED